MRSTVMGVILFTFSIILSTAEARQESEEVSASMLKAKEVYNRGIEQLDTGNPLDALDSFREVIQVADGPQSKGVVASAANNAGNIHLMRGELQTAEKYFRLAVEADDSHSLAFNNLGVVLLQQGKIAEAQKAFEMAVKADPQNTMPLNNLAEVLLEAGNLKMSAEYLVRSLKLQPDNRRALLLLAQIYDLTDMAEHQIQVWDALVKTTDGSLESRLMLASAYLKEGLCEQAERVLTEILNKTPDWPPAMLQMARLRTKQQRYAEAERLLRKVLVCHESDSTAHSDMVKVLIGQGKVDEALQTATAAAEQYPEQAENWFVLGVCYEHQDKIKEAADAYRRAYNTDKMHDRALNNLGVLELKEGNVDRALDYFSKALAANPRSNEVRYNLGKALVISREDYPRGVRLLAAVGRTRGEAGEKARAFIRDLEIIAEGGDPGWIKK
jgi:Tfp pilus assembly protein PilF